MLAMTLTVNLTSWQKKNLQHSEGCRAFFRHKYNQPSSPQTAIPSGKGKPHFSSTCFPGFECPNIVLSSPNSKRTSGQPLESSAQAGTTGPHCKGRIQGFCFICKNCNFTRSLGCDFNVISEPQRLENHEHSHEKEHCHPIFLKPCFSRRGLQKRHSVHSTSYTACHSTEPATRVADCLGHQP